MGTELGKKLKIVIISPMRKQCTALFTSHNMGTDMRKILRELMLIIELLSTKE